MSLLDRVESSTPGPAAGFSDRDASLPVDPRVVAALEEYLALQEAGGPPDRASFLAGHPEVAAELGPYLDDLALVQSAARPLVGTNAEGTPRGPAESAPPTSRLGEFRIARLVGRGGMGVVYEAEQLPLGRRVALKVLPSAASLDPMRRQRFQVEAQAAAHLHHPHIVPVFAVGSDQGAHYYAMQFIEGPTLSAVIRELRERSGRSRGGSGPAASDVPAALSGRGPGFFRAVARLGMQAAEALEHAHGLGVLHRDIKPANLMIDARGELWVTDFGLARFQDEDGLTRTGEVVGTLRYMSPEQAMARHGVVDQRTDVYALGLTLYELLTLRPAFDAQDRQELLRRIALDEPPAPRRVEPAIPRDLETIVLKAAAKDPSHRYATAGELADDLRRFLDDLPIRARRPSPPERLARWSRRHRTALAATAGVLLLGSLLGSALLGMAYQRARANNDRAREALRRSFAVTDALADDALGRLATFEEDPRSGLFYIGALAYYEEIAKLYEVDPQMREMAAAAYHRVGFVQAVLRQVKQHPSYRTSQPGIAYGKAVELYDAEIAASPADPEPREGLARTLTDLAALHRMMWRLVDAERTCRRLVEIRRTLLDRPEARLHLAHDLALHAQSLEMLGRRRDAGEAARESEELWTELAGLARSGDTEARSNSARFGNQISLILAGFAEDRAGRILTLARELDPDDPSLLNNQAWLIAKRPGATADQVRQAVDLGRRAASGAPGRWEMWNTLGLAFLRAGDLRPAIDALTRGMILHRDGDANDWLPLAMALWKEGDHAAARARYDQAVAWIGRHPEEMHLDLFRLWVEAATLVGAPLPAPWPGEPPREIHDCRGGVRGLPFKQTLTDGCFNARKPNRLC